MNILIASSLCPTAIEQLRRHHDVVCAFNAPEDELKQLVGDRDALVFRSGVQITADVMSCAPNLELLVRAGSGLDNLDVDYANSRGIKLIRVPEPGAQAVAELAFGLMLALARQILVADRELRKGHWIKGKAEGYLLRGKTLGVIGAGNIGTRVSEMGLSWGMSVVGCVENRTTGSDSSAHAGGIRLADMSEVLSAADFVSVHVPLKDSTRNLIGAEEFSSMKPGAFFVNLARGGVVDERALFDALTSGQLAGAALDVHQVEGEGAISPLASLENVVLTPHIGATTVDTQREIGIRVINIVESFENSLRQDF